MEKHTSLALKIQAALHIWDFSVSSYVPDNFFPKCYIEVRNPNKSAGTYVKLCTYTYSRSCSKDIEFKNGIRVAVCYPNAFGYNCGINEEKAILPEIERLLSLYKVLPIYPRDLWDSIIEINLLTPGLLL